MHAAIAIRRTALPAHLGCLAARTRRLPPAPRASQHSALRSHGAAEWSSRARCAAHSLLGPASNEGKPEGLGTSAWATLEACIQAHFVHKNSLLAHEALLQPKVCNTLARIQSLKHLMPRPHAKPGGPVFGKSEKSPVPTCKPQHAAREMHRRSWDF